MQAETSSLSNILTQEEIDALLNPQEPAPKSNPFQLLKTTTAPRKYPALEKYIDAFCRSIMTSLHQLTQTENVSATVQSFVFGQLGAYLDTLPSPSMLGFYEIKEWKQSALVSLDFNLTYCLLDMTLGGRRGTSAMSLEGRAYTPIEKSIIQKILKTLTADFNKSFEQTFLFENMDTNPKTALIASPACNVVISRIEISLDKRKGVLDFILPAHLLEQMDDIECPVSTQNDYTEKLKMALYRVPMELNAVLDKKEIPFSSVLKWKAGDTLPLSYFEDKPLEISCQNQVLFKGSLHVNKKNISIQIEKKIFEDF
ncbi:MAG: FliM/FliN family flagellar motor switch protein [Alphaproteobacteria bacterium]|nr:FliM/FliN family flagellar motor switch protein [Alphaproteobacteria bacterium]